MPIYIFISKLFNYIIQTDKKQQFQYKFAIP